MVSTLMIVRRPMFAGAESLRESQFTIDTSETKKAPQCLFGKGPHLAFPNAGIVSGEPVTQMRLFLLAKVSQQRVSHLSRHRIGGVLIVEVLRTNCQAGAISRCFNHFIAKFEAQEMHRRGFSVS